jgi:8-oxo-dGTP pyrophosphatase MutT (NUDIX family)
LADVAMILPLTLSREVVLIDVYKPGADAVLRQFPAGRLESHHQDIRTLAVHELEEETGINIKPHQLELLGTLTGFSTKATAKVTCFIAQNVSFNSHQKLDEFEDIQVVVLSPQEVDYQIRTGQIWCAQTIAFWYLAHQQGHLLPKP